MVVQPDARTGETGVTQDGTPVQVTIKNDSDNPVAVRYRNFVSSRRTARATLRFRADVQDASDSRVFGEISIPFTVNE
jgi:hypothetical protein